MRRVKFGLVLFKRLGVVLLSVCFTKCGNMLNVARFCGSGVFLLGWFFFQPVVTTANDRLGVAVGCVRKRGHHGSQHHPFDPTKFLGICMIIKSIHKKKRQLRKGGRQEWRPVPQYSLMRGRRTFSSLGGDSEGRFYPGQHEGFGGVGRRSAVARVVVSRSGRYPRGHLQEWP